MFDTTSKSTIPLQSVRLLVCSSQVLRCPSRVAPPSLSLLGANRLCLVQRRNAPLQACLGLEQRRLLLQGGCQRAPQLRCRRLKVLQVHLHAVHLLGERVLLGVQASDVLPNAPQAAMCVLQLLAQAAEEGCGGFAPRVQLGKEKLDSLVKVLVLQKQTDGVGLGDKLEVGCVKRGVP